MAYIRKRGTTWRAEVEKAGQRLSASFDTKREAQEWAAKQETEIAAGERGEIPRKTLAEILTRYAREVSPTKRAGDREALRIEYYLREEAVLCAKENAALTAADFASLRDRRLKANAAETVRRDFNTLSAVLNTAVREWGWLRENPLSKVRRPPPARARDRRITADEIERFLLASGYQEEIVRTVGQEVAVAFLLAIETAMRAGEIMGLEWSRVDLQKRVVHLALTKNGRARDVPLSREAVRLLEQLPMTGPRCFSLTPARLDAMFRKNRERAAIEGMRFHDTRHEAITRLAKRLDVLSLARMVGHTDLNELMTYYNESAADMAKRLD